MAKTWCATVTDMMHIPIVVQLQEMEFEEHGECVDTSDEDSPYIDNESSEYFATMIPLSVQAENQLISDSEHNTEYSHFDVVLHQEPQVSMVSTNYYTNKPFTPVCLEPMTCSVESKVSHEDCGDAISPRTYYVHNAHIDQSSFILTKLPEIIRLDSTGMEKLLRLRDIAIDVFLEKDALFKVVACSSQFEFKFRSRKTFGTEKGFIRDVSDQVSRDSKYNREIIRFLLWMNSLITHFREIKGPASVIFDSTDGDNQGKVHLSQRQYGTTPVSVVEGLRHLCGQSSSASSMCGLPVVKSLAKIRFLPCLNPLINLGREIRGLEAIVGAKGGRDKRGGAQVRETIESIPVTPESTENCEQSKQNVSILAEKKEAVSIETLAPCADSALNESRPREERKAVERSTQNDEPFYFQLLLPGKDVERVWEETESQVEEHVGQGRLEKTSGQTNISRWDIVQRANTRNTLNSKVERFDFTSIIPRVGLFKDFVFGKVIQYEGHENLRKVPASTWDDLKLLSNLGHKFPIEKAKKDFLKDVLNIPDCIQPPLQEVEVYNAFVERGYEAEWKRLASFDECPEENWYPAIPLAENGFHFKPRSSVICFFCKIESKTWQRDWNPKQRHEPHCPLPNGEECGNIPMKPSGDNGKYQPAVQAAFDELRISELQTKIQVLLRDSMRSLESFKNPQLPENQMGSLSINVTQGEGQQEHDAMEDEPQPTTSGSNSSQQQQEGAGGLRYFVHSYDERGNPISTSQKMEFNSNEEKANTSMKKETDRLKTFDNVWKKGDVISPKELAKSGFFYAGTGDRVRCAFCNGVLRNWAVGDRAAAEHRRHYPTCPFVLNLDVGNVPYSPDLSGLHTPTAATTKHTEQRRQTASTQRQQSAQSSGASFGAAITPSAVPGTILIPKHSNFTTVESRLLTYDNWPQSNVQRPKQLAEAGFFYTGSSDNVRCFHCDGGLRNWLDSDLPWVEHAKWFPRCGFLQRVKGVEFVLEETRKHNQQNSTTAVAQNRGSTGLTTTPASTPGVGIVERPATGGVRRVEAREVRARFDTDRVKMLLEMGYKEAVVKYVILQRLRYTGDDFSSIQEMLESVLAEQPNLEEKGIAYYENILQQEFGRPMTIVYPQVTQMTGTLDKTAVPSPAPPMTQTTSASIPIPGDEKSLVEENRQLKEQTTCKICMDNEVSMVFVPCGHLVACADCAPNLRQCPICRRAITGTIRTFLS